MEKTASVVGPRQKEQADPLSFDPLRFSASPVNKKAYERIAMITYLKPFMHRPFVIIPILTAVCWLISQKGCVLTPDVSPALTFADVGTSTSQLPAVSVEEGESAKPQSPHANSLSSEAKSRSLRQAGELLRKAAAALDKNERVALRFILQAIAILKHEVMQGITEPDYDHVSGELPTSHSNMLLWKARAMVPLIPEPSPSQFKTSTVIHDVLP